jgi:hypothetical protein
MTEDEAKTKLCCGPLQVATQMVQHLNNIPAKCIGSACMAWRTSGWTRAEDRTMILLGYCGLAGRP